MKANELRIGNWVDNGVGDNYIIDTSWFMDILNFAQVNNLSTDLKPIPLTEEWLIKFGGDCTIMEGYPVYFLNPFSIEFYELECVFHIGNSSTTIKYVHQLQNIYFALTGEELTIKN